MPFEGGEGRDQLIELGSGNLIPGFEEGLLGASAGETRTIEVTFPADYGSRELAGREAIFEITVKEVKPSSCPSSTTTSPSTPASTTSRSCARTSAARLLEADEGRAEAEFRQAALDAAVAGAKVAVTPELATARAREMWERTLHSLAHRGISREAYLQLSGRSEEEILAETRARGRARAAPRGRHHGLVEAEGISPGDEELLEVLTPTAEREGVEPQPLLEDLRGAGRLEEVREDLAARQAIELIAREAKPIPLAQAAGARAPGRPTRRAEQVRAGPSPRSPRRAIRPAVDARSLASRGIRTAKANKARP